MDLVSIVISAAVGALAGQLFPFLTQWLNRRAEERRQLRSLAFQAAIENWKTLLDIARKEPGEKNFEPLDVFLIHAIQFTALMEMKSMTPEDIQKHVRQVREITRAAQEAYKK